MPRDAGEEGVPRDASEEGVPRDASGHPFPTHVSLRKTHGSLLSVGDQEHGSNVKRRC